MLKELSLRSFAIAEKTDLSLKPGMTAITGETGAGKSIMVDALNLLTGQKADSSWIKEGEDKCTISAIFSTDEDPRINDWLQENGFHEEDEVILMRQIRREGKSRNYLNGQPATLAQLKELSQFLLNICSQHDHMNLLKSDNQRVMLDRSLPDKTVIQAVEASFSELRALRKELKEAEEQQASEEAECKLLEYQKEELDDLSPLDGEFASLSEEQKTLQNASEIIESLGSSCQALADGDDTLQDRLSSIIRSVEASEDESKQTKEALTGLYSALTEIEEASKSLSNRLDNIEINPIRLDEVNDRMSEMLSMSRKHGVQPDELPQFHMEVEEKLSSFSSNAERIEELRALESEKVTNFEEAAKVLSEARKKRAKELSKMVVECLVSLGMERAKFEIDINDESHPGPHGTDHVEFMFCANIGQNPKPLKDTASGGELSRVSLALQVIMARFSQLPVMIFDEVDVGIGGNTAAVVGEMLRLMGESNQVITITHQAPVAKVAHHHVLAVKDHVDADQKTVTDMITLDKKGRDQEVKRMVGL